MLNGWYKGQRTGSGTIVWRPREMLVSPRVQAWRADPATVEFLRAAAGPGLDAGQPLTRRQPLGAQQLAGHAS